jgi:molecular chaperone GrpE
VAAGDNESNPQGGDRIASLEQENQRLRDQALRAVADLENFRRRAVTEREQLVMYANERLLRSLLPIVDDFQRSVESGEQTKDFNSFFQGVSMINDKLKRLFEAQGITRIETVGEPFNVELHEALMRQPSEAPEDTVIAELEPGYRYGDRVLRHAKVIVSAGS